MFAVETQKCRVSHEYTSIHHKQKCSVMLKFGLSSSLMTFSEKVEKSVKMNQTISVATPLRHYQGSTALQVAGLCLYQISKSVRAAQSPELNPGAGLGRIGQKVGANNLQVQRTRGKFCNSAGMNSEKLTVCESTLLALLGH